MIENSPTATNNDGGPAVQLSTAQAATRSSCPTEKAAAIAGATVTTLIQAVTSTQTATSNQADVSNQLAAPIGIEGAAVG